uniref:Uncharacterized protein n=1 Tax=Oryza sativa subsp. japonica TaxID=39947 RepID=Q5Z5M1_ORYSJ|nr:hypothetical protein [Oryza sativa Japonica Group]
MRRAAGRAEHKISSPGIARSQAVAATNDYPEGPQAVAATEQGARAGAACDPMGKQPATPVPRAHGWVEEDRRSIILLRIHRRPPRLG